MAGILETNPITFFLASTHFTFAIDLLFFFFFFSACADGVVRVYKLDDASSKSFKYVSLTLDVLSVTA